MKNPSATARTTWRNVVRRFTLDTLTRGRETALIYVVPAAGFLIAEVHEAHSAEELPVGAVVLEDLCYLSIEPRPDAIVLPVNEYTGEVIGVLRLRADMAGEAKALADHLMGKAWSQAIELEVHRQSTRLAE